VREVMERPVVGDRRRGGAFVRFFTPQVIVTLATLVFAAGGLWQKVEATEKRLDRLEAIVMPVQVHAENSLPASSPPAQPAAESAAAAGSGPVGLFVSVRNFIWR
jgi:hypothetical protein